MSTHRSLERSIAIWMADEAAGSASDAVLDNVLSATGRMRPEPRWLALLKEPPMRTRSLVTVGSPTARLTLILLILGSLLVGTAAAGVLLRPSQGAGDWLGVRNDPAHSGTGIVGPLGNPVVRWTFRADGAVRENLSIVGDLVLAPSDDGILHALDLDSGVERWTMQVSAPAYGPSFADGSIYLADGDGVIHALSIDDGAERWRSASLESASVLTVAGGRVFAGTSAGEVVAMDAATGAESWRSPVGGQSQLERPLAYADGRVFAAVNGLGLVALDEATGRQIWTFARAAGLGTPVVAGSTVFVSGGDRLAALDTGTGSVRWDLDQDLGTPAILGDVGFGAGPDGVVTGYDLASGTIRWRTAFTGALRPLAVADGVAYVSADTERRVVALDAVSGVELWSFDVDVSAVDPNEVRRFDPAGNLTGTFGTPSSGPGAFSDPTGLDRGRCRWPRVRDPGPHFADGPRRPCLRGRWDIHRLVGRSRPGPR